MKFILMMHVPANAPAGAGIASWKPEEVKNMIQFMKELNADLSARGELASAEGLDYPPRPRIVRAQDDRAPRLQRRPDHLAPLGVATRAAPASPGGLRSPG